MEHCAQERPGVLNSSAYCIGLEFAHLTRESLSLTLLFSPCFVPVLLLLLLLVLLPESKEVHHRICAAGAVWSFRLSPVCAGGAVRFFRLSPTLCFRHSMVL